MFRTVHIFIVDAVWLNSRVEHRDGLGLERTVFFMQSCPHCGSREVRNAPKCPSCGAIVAPESQPSSTVYKPTWLDGVDNDSSKKTSRRKRGRGAEKATPPTEACDTAVIRLHDETYINGEFVPSSIAYPVARPIPLGNFSISDKKGQDVNPSTTNIVSPYPSQPTPTAEPDTVEENVDQNGEEFFAAEFWVQPEDTTPLVGESQHERSFQSDNKPGNAVRQGFTYSAGARRTQTLDGNDGRSSFTPTDFLDRSISKGGVYIAAKQKSSSRKWLVALCVVMVIVGMVVYFIGGGRAPELNLPGIGGGESNSSTGLVIKSFGSPIKAKVEDISVRSTEQLDASLFPISCSPERGTITGYAFIVAAEGADANESVALSTGGNVRDCLEDRVAYLHDSRSALRVKIEGYDADQGLIWLRVPAPLPGQAIAVTSQPGIRQVGIYTKGVSSFVEPTPGIAAPGAPVLVENGVMVAIYGDARTPLDLSSACGTILAC